MPRIEAWGNFPPGVRRHLIDRMRDRDISTADLNQLRLWVDSNPEVPEGDWYKNFDSSNPAFSAILGLPLSKHTRARDIISLMSNPNTLLELIQVPPGAHTAVVLPESGLRVTYQSLCDQVRTMADDLASLGIQSGDRVATVLPNGLPAIVSFIAASVAGTAAPLNPGYREDEFSFYLEDTGAKILLCPPDGADAARKAADTTGILVYSLETSDAGVVRIAGAPGGKTAAPALSDDIALVLHTSGSTGRPKRVPILHRNITASAKNIVAHYSLTPDDVSLCVMPLFHVHGLVASTLSTLLSGGAVVVPSKFNPLSFWRTARDTGATWYSAVPTIHSLLLSRAGNERPAGSEGLRFIRSCSAALPPEMMNRMEEVFGAPVLEAYGMTEASHQMASSPQPPGARKPGSVGPGTGVQIGIMDDAGQLLAVGERGEVVIKGPNVVSGYENNPEANAKSYTDGWFRTGDQGFLDTDRYLTLTGRLKELINRGGEKIGPREIDEVLLTHPAIAEAVAFGVPHATWGEEVAAAVVLKENSPATEPELLAFCKERLADYKRPKKFYIVDAIPRTATGKIQRGAVAKALAGA
jgi:acyl-CoA synthetase (AMP-forming)/AMP-acid ligase II